MSGKLRNDVLPVVVVTGFLGAGKTTLLKRVLEAEEIYFKVGALVNDFATLNIDYELIKRKSADGVVELSNGCICCSLGSDLKSVVWQALRDSSDSALSSVDYLIVETSGITDPVNVVLELENFTTSLDLSMKNTNSISNPNPTVSMKNTNSISNEQRKNSHQSHEEIGSETFRSQLLCADVVILNVRCIIIFLLSFFVFENFHTKCCT
eukprot:GSMAST32.ASY1.ANO1.1943.1 assembled CDS